MVRGDPHIHTVLSPCGDVEMTPAFIVGRALEAGYDFIGITDHNTTRQYIQVAAAAQGSGLTVLCGAEITTREEIHVLVFVAQEQQQELQCYLDRHMGKIPNRPELFGYQLVVDMHESVLYEEPNLLISAIDRSLEQVEEFAHSIGGIFIAAHIDKRVNSIMSQLGFVPPDLKADALELSIHTTAERFVEQNPGLNGFFFVQSSDAHYPQDLGSCFTELDIPDAKFETIRDFFYSKRGV